MLSNYHKIKEKVNIYVVSKCLYKNIKVTINCYKILPNKHVNNSY